MPSDLWEQLLVKYPDRRGFEAQETAALVQLCHAIVTLEAKGLLRHFGLEHPVPVSRGRSFAYAIPCQTCALVRQARGE